MLGHVARKVGKEKVVVSWTGSQLVAWMDSLSWAMTVAWVVGLSPETPHLWGKSWLGLLSSVLALAGRCPVGKYGASCMWGLFGGSIKGPRSSADTSCCLEIPWEPLY